MSLCEFTEEKDEANDKKNTSKPVRSKAKLISPQLLACKIGTNTVEMPPALRQRHIQLQALNATRTSGECDNNSNSAGNSTSDEDSGPDENGYFESYLVIEFSPNIQKKTLHWIIDKIRTKVSRGGAGLLVRREPQTK